MLNPPVAVLVAWTSWIDLTSMIDDPRVALALLIGSVVLCGLLVLGRSPPKAHSLEPVRGLVVKPDADDATSEPSTTIGAVHAPLSSIT